MSGPFDPAYAAAQAAGATSGTVPGAAMPVGAPVVPGQMTLAQALAAHPIQGSPFSDIQAAPAQASGLWQNAASKPGQMTLAQALAAHPVQASPFGDVANLAGIKPAAYGGRSTVAAGPDASAAPPGPTVFLPPGASTAPKYSPWNPRSGTTKVGAVNQDLTAPEYQAAMQEELARQQGNYAGKGGSLVGLGDAKAGSAEGQASAVGKVGEKIDQLADHDERSDKDWKPIVKDLQGKSAAATAKMLQAKLQDPATREGVGTKIMDILASAVGGFAQGIGRLPTNPGLVGQQQRREGQLGIQKANIALQRDVAGDYHTQLQDALASAAAGRADQARRNDLRLKAVETLPQQAALAGQAPVERANAGVQAADTQLQAADAGIAGVREQMAEHKYIPAHTVNTGPNMQAIKDRAAKIVMDSKGVIDPDEALRQSIAIESMGHNTMPGTPYQSWAKDADNVGKDVTKLGAGLGGTSTAYNPMRYIQGTEAHANDLKHENYNSALLEAAGKMGSPRLAHDIVEKLAIQSGDTEATIATKRNEAVQRFGKGVAASPVGQVDGFTEAGAEK